MASTYLERTPASTGNQSTYTFSAWIKRSGISSNNQLFGAGYGNNARETYFLLDSNDKLNIFSGNYTTGSSTTTSMQLITDRVFRDTSAFYHIVIEVDTTQATASDRVKLYVNGVQETLFGTETYPSQNDTHFVNVTTTENQVGALNGGNTHDGSMAHVHWIDGTAYDASTFGETDATTGIWKPKTAPSVTYGTNGFFLKFENSGAFGTDSSGNANNFTVNGTMTQTIDTPSNVFATMNPLANFTGQTFTNGNTTVGTTSGNSVHQQFVSTLGVSSGKYYWETKNIDATTSSSRVGISSENVISNPANLTGSGGHVGDDPQSYGYVASSGNKETNDSSSSYGNSFTNGDILMVALDLDNNKLYFGKNGTWQNSGDPTSGATGTGAAFTVTSNLTYFPAVSILGGSEDYSFNFGNGYFGTTAVSSAQNPDDGIGIFEFSPPVGYKSLCTKSINSQEYD